MQASDTGAHGRWRCRNELGRCLARVEPLRLSDASAALNWALASWVDHYARAWSHRIARRLWTSASDGCRRIVGHLTQE